MKRMINVFASGLLFVNAYNIIFRLFQVKINMNMFKILCITFYGFNMDTFGDLKVTVLMS